uniref:Uncharacterized protein n=1 Tax=Romanomermis culicivorax TaxID=13658 RepID=A0A915HTZ6_ROMCU
MDILFSVVADCNIICRCSKFSSFSSEIFVNISFLDDVRGFLFTNVIKPSSLTSIMLSTFTFFTNIAQRHISHLEITFSKTLEQLSLPLTEAAATTIPPSGPTEASNRVSGTQLFSSTSSLSLPANACLLHLHFNRITLMYKDRTVVEN